MLNFNSQYSISYIARFNELSSLIKENLDKNYPNLSLQKLSEDIDQKCVVIAILFLDSRKKPSILFNVNEPGENYHTDAKLYIEDSCGKIAIEFTSDFLSLPILSSGMVLGFVGSKNSKNIFECSEIVFPVEVPVKKLESTGKVLIVGSSLMNNIGFPYIKLLVDHCANKVTDIIMFGNLFSSDTTEGLENFNLIFDHLASKNIKIHLVPGKDDPTTLLIPQEPFNKLFFNKSLSKTLVLHSSPCSINVSNASFIFLNKYIVDDLLRYKIAECNELEALEVLYKIRHICPHGPDTIPTVPLSESDPFIVKSCDFLLLGASDTFTCKKVKNSYLVTIPDFDKVKTGLIVDLSTHSITEISIDI